MENWNKPQNESFSKIFDAIKIQANPANKVDVLTLMNLNDENFIRLYRDTAELTGDQEDIDLCMQRASYLGYNINH